MKKGLSWKRILIGSIVVIIAAFLVVFSGLRIYFTGYLNAIGNHMEESVQNKNVIYLSGMLEMDSLLAEKTKTSLGELLGWKRQSYEHYVNLVAPRSGVNGTIGYNDTDNHLLWKFAFFEQMSAANFEDNFFWLNKEEGVTYLEVLDVQIKYNTISVSVNEQYEELIVEYHDAIIDGSARLMPLNFNEENHNLFFNDDDQFQIVIMEHANNENLYTLLGLAEDYKEPALFYMFNPYLSEDGELISIFTVNNPEFLYEKGYVFDLKQ